MKRKLPLTFVTVPRLALPKLDNLSIGFKTIKCRGRDGSSKMSNPFEMNIVPFGKFKGKTYIELESDTKYCKWLLTQPWFASKFPDVERFLIGKGLQSQKHNTHNIIQSWFSDDEMLMKLVKDVLSGIDSEKFTVTKMFEHMCGADIVICVQVPFVLAGNPIGSHKYHILVEIKPNIGNDYPDILRQMNFQRHNYSLYCPLAQPEQIKQVLVYQTFDADIPEEIVRKLFVDIDWYLL